MKIFRFSKLVLLAVILVFSIFSSANLNVLAKTPNNKPDPNFQSTASYVQQTRRPWYSKTAKVNIYQADGLYYEIDATSGMVTQIQPSDINYKIDATYTQNELKKQAQTMVANFTKNKVNLNSLSLTIGKKIGTYFFRWENKSQKLEDGSSSFIQVGLSQNGDFLNFVNTIPFATDNRVDHQQIEERDVTPNIGPFNEIYANADSSVSWNTTYFKKISGTMSATTGGYYYLAGSPVCTQTYCTKFAYTSATGGTSGAWYPNANANVQAAVFVPSTHATQNVTYTIKRTNGTSFTSASVNQNAFYNAWANITTSTVANGIKQVTLVNNGLSSNEVAWDELWVYNP